MDSKKSMTAQNSPMAYENCGVLSNGKLGVSISVKRADRGVD